MTPQVGDIWHWHHEVREEQAIVLIHEFMCETRNLTNKPVMVFWGYDMITGQYDEWLFTDESYNKNHWKKLA